MLIPILFCVLAVLCDNYTIDGNVLNYIPVGPEIDMRLFRKALSDGVGKINVMRIPKGRYGFSGFRLNCGNNRAFMIDFQGSTLDPVRNDFRFVNCISPGISNVILMRDIRELEYTQGTVTHIQFAPLGSDIKIRSNITIQTHKGYRPFTTKYNQSISKDTWLTNTGPALSAYQYIFDPISRKPKLNGIIVGSAETLNDDGLISMTSLTDKMKHFNVSIGDYVATPTINPNVNLTGIYGENCSHARFENITSIGFMTNLYSEFGGLYLSTYKSSND